MTCLFEAELRLELERAFTRLAPNRAEALRLKLAGYTAREIGERMACEPNTVRSRLSRGRAALFEAVCS